MAYRILLVDDETDILEFVRYNLSKEGYEVYTATDGAEAVRTAAECRPHLILLDMMMPVMDGVQTCRALRALPATSGAIIVFLSALGEDESQLSGFDAGADDYITKPIKMTLLKSRVNALLRRVDDSAPESGIEISRERHTVMIDGTEIALPRKEFALFDLLYSQPGRLFTREEIYSHIWGSSVVVGDRTIDVHIRRLRCKIGDRHIVTVKGLGYKFQK
ncbi:MAG TPA: response regulator transcription factor [Candidatus Alistipes excrementipullorum]|nr:response regulator transcription factor [Candidatus Alistipes excrementipullorum]